MAKTKKTTGTDSRYKQFLENIELLAIGLESLSSSLERADYSKAVSERPSDLIYEIRSRFEISEFDDHHFDVSASFTFETKIKAQTPLILVEATFSAHFHSKKNSLQKKYAEQFAGSEARLVFWPYFRQTVADITSRMHIRPITIPMSFKP
jgi:preprotein translocase subunit SecB